MAAKDTGKKPAGGGAKKTSKARKAYQLYTLSGDKIQRKNKSCPKCGPGIFLAIHGNRVHCGACKYTEFAGKR